MEKKFLTCSRAIAVLAIGVFVTTVVSKKTVDDEYTYPGFEHPVKLAAGHGDQFSLSDKPGTMWKETTYKEWLTIKDLRKQLKPFIVEVLEVKVLDKIKIVASQDISDEDELNYVKQQLIANNLPNDDKWKENVKILMKFITHEKGGGFVMDVKLGTKTYQPGPMIEVNPKERQKRMEGIVEDFEEMNTYLNIDLMSKRVRMAINNFMSSTDMYGFRITGMASIKAINLYHEKYMGRIWATRNTPDKVYAKFAEFLGTSEAANESFLKQLTEIRGKLKIVERRYNLYGTSLCIMVKGDEVAVVLIDFAKAMKVDDSNRPEEIYSAEGLDNIIKIVSNPASPALRTFGLKTYDDIVDLIHDKGWGNDKFKQEYSAGQFKA